MNVNFTSDRGASEALGINVDGDPPNLWEQSEYADPTPIPAANAREDHFATGLPDTINP